MGTTIGVKFTGSVDGKIISQLESLILSSGYAYVSESHAENDIREGLQQAIEARSWTHVFLLRSPVDAGVSIPAYTADEIQQGLEDIWRTGTPPEAADRFFRFLHQYANLVSSSTNGAGIFFATEWLHDDSVHYDFGPIEALITRLSSSSSWGEQTLLVRTGSLSLDLSTPFLFELASR